MSSDHFRWLVDGVLAGGPHPDPFGEPPVLARALEELGRHGLGAILSATERPLSLPAGCGIDYLHAATPDGEAPEDLEHLCAFIDAGRRRGVGTFVHCQAGHGRTGTVLAAWLIWSEGRRRWDAVDEVRRVYHRLAVETDAQLLALDALARRHRLL